MRLYDFDEGIFVTDASPEYSRLVGTRLVAIESTDVKALRKILDPLIPRDNPMTVRLILPTYLAFGELLEGLGIVGASSQARFTFVDGSGQEQSLVLRAEPLPAYLSWAGPLAMRLPERPGTLYLQRVHEAFWHRLLENQTLYLQVNQTTDKTGTGMTLADFCSAVLRDASRPGVERVVLDLRHNLGGDNTTFGPLVEMLKNPVINRRGHLYVLIGRAVFSAGVNLVTAIERETAAIFAGEPTGGSPNQFGDAAPVELPHSRLVAKISTRYWEPAGPGDSRQWHEPQMRIEPSARSFFSDRDDLLDAVMRGNPGSLGDRDHHDTHSHE
jgi:hypothetical protein